MREDWKEYRFDEIALFPPKIKMKKGEKYPFIPMENLDGGYKYVKPVMEKQLNGGGAKFEEGDTLFARITPCLQNGKIAQVKELGGKPAFGSTEYFVFRGIKGLSDSDFIYYLSKTLRFRGNAENSMVGASGRQRADAGFVRSLKVSIPPLPTQRKIASILSAYDDLIENNFKRIKLLEEKAQLTYEEWFVRMKFPGHETTPINEETGLPEGWERKYFKDILNFKTGKLDSNALVENGLFDFYTCAKEVYKTDTFCFEGEAVLLGGNNATGDFALFYANDKFDAYQRTYIVTSQLKNVPLVYIFFYLKKLLPYFQIVSSGASTKFLTMKILNKTKIILPSDDILKQYLLIVKPCFHIVLELQKQNQLLKEARDILLPRLMTGMIDVEKVTI